MSMNVIPTFGAPSFFDERTPEDSLGGSRDGARAD